MIPHISAGCPVDPATPVAYWLADGIQRFEPEARALCWADLALDEGRVIGYLPLQRTKWLDPKAWPWAARWGQMAIEAKFTDGSTAVDLVANLHWPSIALFRIFVTDEAYRAMYGPF